MYSNRTLYQDGHPAINTRSSDEYGKIKCSAKSKWPQISQASIR